MLHPIAKCLIPLLDHIKPTRKKNVASNNRLFWKHDKFGYRCRLPQQLLTNFC
jgi:hypothetical protein